MPASPGPQATPAEVRQLSLIRYLFELGNAQARQPDPLAGTAMLLWHGALELFLHLAAEHLGAENSDKDRAKIMEYFPPINAKLGTAGPLPQKEALQRLNRVRGALKHSAVPPARESIEEAERALARFFEQAVPMAFGISLGQISLASFVRCREAREQLQAALEALEASDFQAALTASASAFYWLIQDYEARVSDRFGRSPFFGDTFERSESERLLSTIRGFSFGIDGDYYTNKAMQAISSDLSDIHTALNVLTLGIDARKHLRFRLLTPRRRVYYRDHQPVEEWQFSSKALPPSDADVQFCIDFVVESALRVQEFSFVYQEEVDGH